MLRIMIWKNRICRKRDFLVVIVGVIIMQALVCLLINRFMFHPVKGGYDETLDGYMNLLTNDVSIAVRSIGLIRGGMAVLYCHGNAEDLTSINGRFNALAANGYAVVTFDYPGYGLSDGYPNEKGCYRNAHRTYDWLVGECGITPDNIFVVGYSIGTGVAIDLAVTRKIGGLWLEAAYLSVPRILTRVRLLPIDPFPNVQKIKDVECPVVMVHGTKDDIVPYSHGRRLFEYASYPKWFVSVENAGHTDFIDIMGREKYDATLLRFIQGGCLVDEMSGKRTGVLTFGVLDGEEEK